MSDATRAQAQAALAAAEEVTATLLPLPANEVVPLDAARRPRPRKSASGWPSST